MENALLNTRLNLGKREISRRYHHWVFRQSSLKWSCGNSWLGIDMSSVSCEVISSCPRVCPSPSSHAGLMVLRPDTANIANTQREPKVEKNIFKNPFCNSQINHINVWVLLTPLSWTGRPLPELAPRVTESPIWQDSSRKCYWIIIWEPAAITTFCIDPTTVHLYCSWSPLHNNKVRHPIDWGNTNPVISISVSSKISV